MKKLTGLLLPLLLNVQSISADPLQKPAASADSLWADSVFRQLSPEQRIAQLFMVAAYSNKGPEHLDNLLTLVKDYGIGGCIFMQGGPVRQASRVNRLQAASGVPLLIATDAEWGLNMRLDSTIRYPYQMTLGAIQNNKLIYKMGAAVARQLKQVGVRVNFAPVVDVNNNPENPVINFRSFGEDRNNVARKGIAYMKGMQDNGVMATAKHFPGHGDTDTDSHATLPTIPHNRYRLDSLEMYPFRQIIDAGINGVMTAHLNIPALDSSGRPATLSKSIISGLLKDTLGFEGLVFTDAMNMGGVTGTFPPGIVDREAVIAGNDILEFTQDVPKAVNEIKAAIADGRISAASVNERCKKILRYKHRLGLHNWSALETDNLVNSLNTAEDQLLKQQLVEASLTVLNNRNNLMPLKALDTLKIAAVSIGSGTASTPFINRLKQYTGVNGYQLAADAGNQTATRLIQELSGYNLVILGLHDNSRYPRNRVNYSETVLSFIHSVQQNHRSVIGLFKNPYTLSKLPVNNSDGLIVAYQDTRESQEAVASLIFGGIQANGKLPVTASENYRLGAGLTTDSPIRLNYTLPEAADLNGEKMAYGIDSLVQEALDAQAIPGCQVLVAKDTRVVFHKAYGRQQFGDTTRVTLTDLYDIASVTKISSALPALMQLHDRGMFSIDTTLATYFPYFKGSDKGPLTFRNMLAHQAGLYPWIPYWKNTLRNNGSFKWFTFKRDSSARFPIKVASNLYLHRNYKKKIYRAIKKSPLSNEVKYRYSGLSFYLYPEIVKNLSGQPLPEYLYTNLYGPLGATTLKYTPLDHFPKSKIVPTEYDLHFRQQLIHGRVHDEGAIMMGGVSANAGLFSNANDLAKLMQMYLNAGSYGGKEYISKTTMAEFTRYQFPEDENRRGLGFDKPNLVRQPNDNAPASASPQSFGHSGFTGTYVWMDPVYNLLYIFLSNRVNPTRNNRGLLDLNTRTKIGEVVYQSVTIPEPQP